MSNLWLDTFLGKTGKYIIGFIDSYYIYIIPLIIAYGIFLAIASCNLKRIERQVSQRIISQTLNILKKNPKINYTDLIDEISIDWEGLIKKYSFFPYISEESGFWISKVNVFNVREIIMHNDRKIRLILERSGILIVGNRGQTRRNLYVEYFHRISRK